MSVKLDELKSQLEAHLKAARDIADAAEKDGDRDFSPEERSAVEGHLNDAKTVKEAIKAKAGEQALKDQIDALGEGIELMENSKTREAAVKAAAQGILVPQRGETVGETFVKSPEYQAFLNDFPKDEHGQARITEKTRVQSRPVGFKNLITGASDTSGGAFVQTDYTGIYEGLGYRPFTIRDIISVRQTNSDTVHYVRQTSRTNAAAPVPEATISTAVPESDPNNTAGVKPKSAMALEPVTATVKTIAHWIPATRRALSDAAQLRGLIDQELRDGLREEEEDQIVNGSGAGENFEGLDTVSGTQNQQFSTGILQTARKARTKVATVGRAQPTAYLMHPNDWEAFDLLLDGENRFYFGGPTALGTPRLWGLPVVESEAVDEGHPWVGDFRKAVLWDREQANITVSDSHADFFIRNMVAILAEERAAFGVTRPSAFVEFSMSSSVSA